jgi:hypothetical protein
MADGFLCDKCDHFDVPTEKVEICKKCYASLLSRASAWDSLPKKVKKSIAVDTEEDDIDSVVGKEDDEEENEDGDEEERKPKKVVKKSKGKGKKKGKKKRRRDDEENGGGGILSKIWDILT